ncbi:MAG: hypothetical protein ABIO96_09150 [Nitrospiraceae bacterium]
MKKLIVPFMFAIIFWVGMASFSFAADVMTAPSTQTIKGDLLRIDGDFFVVKDTAGKEIRLHVDKASQLDGNFKAGDKIEAQATETGHASSVRPAKPKM